MLSINLLPPQEKKALWFEETHRMVVFFTVGILIIFVVGSTLLLPTYISIFIETRDRERALALEGEASKKLNLDKVIARGRALKSVADTLEVAVQDSGRASRILEFLGNAGPGIVITNLGVRKDNTVAINGRAETRDNLLDYEKTLREKGWFQAINSPLSNIIRETNINFVLEGKLKSPYGLLLK